MNTQATLPVLQHLGTLGDTTRCRLLTVLERREFSVSELCQVLQLPQPTVSRHLKVLAEDGWVTYREEQKGNRPPRRVYAITDQGEDAFQRLLRENLATYQPMEFTYHIGLAFLDELSAAEALPLLSERRTAMESFLESIRAHGEHPGSMQLMLEYQVHLLTAELEWLDVVVARIEATKAEPEAGGGNGSWAHG